MRNPVKKQFFSGTGRRERIATMGLYVKPVPEDLIYVRKNIKVAHRAIAYTVARVMAFIAVDLLAQALPRTPWDTGELRRSGTATITTQGYSVIGTGTKRGVVDYDYSQVDPRKASRAHYIN